MAHRDKTRRERYDEKKKSAKTYPISVATVNFLHDGNVGFLIRAAACFGAQCVHVIGSVPHHKILNELTKLLRRFMSIGLISLGLCASFWAMKNLGSQLSLFEIVIPFLYLCPV